MAKTWQERENAACIFNMICCCIVLSGASLGFGLGGWMPNQQLLNYYEALLLTPCHVISCECTSNLADSSAGTQTIYYIDHSEMCCVWENDAGVKYEQMDVDNKPNLCNYYPINIIESWINSSIANDQTMCRVGPQEPNVIIRDDYINYVRSTTIGYGFGTIIFGIFPACVILAIIILIPIWIYECCVECEKTRDLKSIEMEKLERKRLEDLEMKRKYATPPYPLYNGELRININEVKDEIKIPQFHEEKVCGLSGMNVSGDVSSVSNVGVVCSRCEA